VAEEGYLVLVEKLIEMYWVRERIMFFYKSI